MSTQQTSQENPLAGFGPNEWIVEAFAHEIPEVFKNANAVIRGWRRATAGPRSANMIVAARSNTIEASWKHSP